MPDAILTVLGIDFGTKKIGLAIGDTLIRSARPLGDIPNNAGVPDWQQLLDIIAKYRVAECIVGLPLNMDGSKQRITLLVEQFAIELQSRASVPVHTIDERLTSVAAKDMIHSAKKPGKRNKLKQRGLVDAYAAKIILDDWLQS